MVPSTTLLSQVACQVWIRIVVVFKKVLLQEAGVRLYIDIDSVYLSKRNVSSAFT